MVQLSERGKGIKKWNLHKWYVNQKNIFAINLDKNIVFSQNHVNYRDN